MKVNIKRVNKNHKMHEFLDEFVESGIKEMDITIIQDEYYNPWSLYMSVWHTARRFKIRVRVHRDLDRIYIERLD